MKVGGLALDGKKCDDLFGGVAWGGCSGGTGVLPVADEERTALLLNHGQEARAAAPIARPYLKNGTLTRQQESPGAL
jgi:hypothetical protein